MLLLSTLQAESMAKRGRAIVAFSLLLTSITPCCGQDSESCVDGIALASVFFLILTWEASAVLTLNRKRPVLSLKSSFVQTK